MPGTREVESGSASTGQPATSAKRSTVSGWTPAPQPATTSPPRPVGHEMRERVEQLDRRCAHAGRVARPRPVVGAAGRVDELVAGGHQRLAERQVEVHRPGRRTAARRPTARGRQRRASAAPAPGRSVGHSGVVEPAHRVAEELHLVDGLPRAGVAQLGRAVGGAHDQRDAAVVRLEHRGVEVRGRGARRAQHDHGTARSPAASAEGEERRRALVEVHVHAGSASSPASASASGAERDPGARHGVGDAVRAPTRRRACGRRRCVGVVRLMEGCLRGWRTSCSCTGSRRPVVVGPGRRRAARAIRRSCALCLVPDGRRPSARRSTDAAALGDRERTATYVGLLAWADGCACSSRSTDPRSSTAGAGERVARHRRRRRAGRPRRGRRAAGAGDRARRRRRVPRALARAAAVRHALPAERGRHRRAPGPNTVERLAHQLRVLGPGRAAVELGPAGRAADAGAAGRRRARRQVRRHRASAWPTRIADARVEVDRRRRAHVSPRATRAASLTCSLPSPSSAPAGRRRARPGARRSTPSIGASGSWARRRRAQRASPGRTRTAARAARRPARLRRRCPTDVSIIELTTAGTPAASATAERGAHAAERLLLEHDHVGGIERAERRASSSERMHSSAAIGTSTRAAHRGQVVERRHRLLDVLEVERRQPRDHRRPRCRRPTRRWRRPAAPRRVRPRRAPPRTESTIAARRAPSPSPPGSRAPPARVNGPSTARSPAPCRARGREAVARPPPRPRAGRRPGRTDSPGAASTRPTRPDPRGQRRPPSGRRDAQPVLVRTGTAPRSRSTATTTSSFDVATSTRDQRRRVAAGEDRAHRRDRERQREQPEQRPGLREPMTTTDSERARRSRRRRGAGGRSRRAAPRACACPSPRRWATSRTLLASRIAQASRPDDERAPPRRRGHLARPARTRSRPWPRTRRTPAP